MIGRIFRYLFISMIYLVSAYFLTVEIALLLSIKDGLIAGNITYESLNWRSFFTLNPKIVYWQGNNNYRNLALLIALIGFIFLIDVLFFSKNKNKNNEREKTRLDRKEKRNYAHLANWFEKRSGLQRINYNTQGDLTNPMYSKTEANIGTALIGNGLVFLFLFLIKLIIAFIRFVKADFKEAFTLKEFGSVLFVPDFVLNKIYEISFMILILTPFVFFLISSFPSKRRENRRDITYGMLFVHMIQKVVGGVQLLTAAMFEMKLYRWIFAKEQFSLGSTMIVLLIVSVGSSFVIMLIQRVIRSIEIKKLNYSYFNRNEHGGSLNE